MIDRRKFDSALAAAVATLAAPTQAQPSGRELVIGQIGLSFYQVVSGVVQVCLDRLGLPYRIVEGSHGEMYPRLAAGEVDLLVAAWLPHAHGPLHTPTVSSTFEVGTLYDDARLFWAVPAYVPAAEVRSIEDLLKPAVVTRMDKRIVGIGPDSGLMRGAAQIHSDYGLGASGYQIVTGSAADWVANTRAVLDAKRWAAIPLWQPQWMMKAFELRVLNEPKAVYKPDRCVLVASNRLRTSLPLKAQAVLARLSLGVNTVTELDYAMNIGGMSPKQAAQQWMDANPQGVSAWFA